MTMLATPTAAPWPRMQTGAKAPSQPEQMMFLSFPSRRLVTAVLALGVFVAPVAGAQSLPPAKDLIDRYASAVGGDKWKSHKSARMKATMEVPTAGLSANIEASTVYPSAFVMKMVIGGMGEIVQGYDGTTAWMKDPMMGARILEGAEAEQVADEADPEAALRQSSRIASSETVEKTTINGTECYKVKHTWKSGRVTHDCFSTFDGLLVASIANQASAMGEAEVTTIHTAYKDFGGIMRASVVTTQMMGQEARTTITSWEWDVVDPKDVEPPADVKALIKK
jgi:hypothetical protein